MRRVVVTGMGMINAVGHDKESSFKAICDGECGIDTISIYDPETTSVRIAGEVKGFDPTTVMEPKEVKKADRFYHFRTKAAQEALARSKYRGIMVEMGSVFGNTCQHPGNGEVLPRQF